MFGASGAVGGFLLSRLGGERVWAVSRQPRPPGQGDVQWIAGDLDGDVSLPKAVEAIFSCGPLDAFARWYARSATGTARVLAISSMSVFSKRDSEDAAERDVAARLGSAEAQVLHIAAGRGAHAVVLRPTLIYGSGRDRSLAPVARWARRWRLFPRLQGASGLRQPVHADDLAQACIAALRASSTAGRCYALGGGERLDFAQMIERTCRSLDVACVGIPMPIALLAQPRILRIAAALGWTPPGLAAIARMRVDLLADNDAAARDFGWAPRPFEPDAAHWPRQP